MDLTHLPKELEEIIRNYVAQMSHYEKYMGVLMEIDRMNYFNSTIDNCCSFGIHIKDVRHSYHIKMCRDCGNYYRTSIIIYKRLASYSMRYSYYNSWVNGNEDIVESNYIVNYNGQSNMSWRNFYTNRRHHKHISCICLRELFGMLGW